MFGENPDYSARGCAGCLEKSAEWAAQPEGKRFAVSKGWCWKAAERRADGLPAPEDPTACLSPCPTVTERSRALLKLVGLASRQLRMGFNGPYAFDWGVMARLADDSGVETDEDWWALLSVVEGEYLDAMDERQKQAALASKTG